MKILNLYICTILLVLISGCRKFVELDPPNTLIVTQTTFKNDGTAISAVTGIYSDMVEKNTMTYLIPLYTGLGSDELNNFSTFNENIQVYKNSLKAVDAGTNKIWTTVYNYIYQANAVFEGCTASNTLTPALKKQLMAEAMFIRAYWYFYLVNFYGDVPLVTKTDYQSNATLSRTSTDLIYQEIISDLKYAQANLSVNYVGANGLSTVSDRVRPNNATATALLSKVYLYTGKYADAETQATSIINNTSAYEMVDLAKVFQIDSREAIWQLMKPTPTNNINTYEGNSFILTTPPMTNFQNSTTISNTLWNAFEPGDQRKVEWIGKFTDVSSTPNIDYYYPYKYKVYYSSTISEYSMVFRLGEQYLIRAEARAQLGKLTDAIHDLDIIRHRAGLPLVQDTNPGISKQGLLSAIYKERQTELFTEGHRWFDLKRTNRIDAVMQTESLLKGNTWNTGQKLYPIPQNEINNDPNLKQNQGYN